MRLKETESDVLRAVCEYLALKRHFFWRANNIPVWDGKNFRAMPKYSMKGLPDIMLIINGFCIGLELKTATGRMSPEQKDVEKKFKDSGAEYYLIRSIDDLKQYGI